MAPVNDWESRGTCGIHPSIEEPVQGSTKSGGSIKQADKTRNTEDNKYLTENNPKQNDDKIIFPVDDTVETEDLEAFGIHKLGY